MVSERQLTLDGIRGLACCAVLASHYLAELPGGIRAFAFGAIAVDVFFVLSGFLIGRLILTRRAAPNFFRTFYIRRLLRTVPSYLIVVVITLALAALLPEWAGDTGGVPGWSHLTFTQNLFFARQNTTGLEWLSPTWTLAVEEQFYLFAPAVLVFLPRRLIIPVAIAVFSASLLYRVLMATSGASPLAFLPLLLARADTLAAGIIAGVLWFKLAGTKHFDRILEATPLVSLLIAVTVGALASSNIWQSTVAHSLFAIGAAAFILRAAVSPDAVRWLEARWLRFMGDNSYSIYLIHMPVAGIAHHLIVGTHPALTTPLAWLATAVATVATIVVGRGLTRCVEEPLTAFGRRFSWDQPKVSSPRIA
ncbi:acyltransferase family protein [Bosea sp. LjRoot237]|uniref:acyltransferase family protein n=1 Tax=Bosea sp. LjRoot237 TaxID=3342292 RepID=UPI003ECEB5A4